MGSVSLQGRDFVGYPVPSRVSKYFRCPLPGVEGYYSPTLIGPYHVFRRCGVYSKVRDFFGALRFFRVFFVRSVVHVRPRPMVNTSFFRGGVAQDEGVVAPKGVGRLQHVLLHSLFYSI